MVGVARLAPAVRYAVAGVAPGRRRWHTHGESANTETSTLLNGVPERAPTDRMAVDVDACPVAADRRRPAAARARPSALDEPDPLRAHDPRCARTARTPAAALAAALTQAELRVRARGEVRRAGRVDVLHARRARAGHPALGRRRTGPPGWSAFGATTVVDLGCGIGGDLVAFARAGLIRAGRRPRPGAGRGRHAPTSPPSGCPARSGWPTRTTMDTVAVRRGLRRPRPAHRPRPDASRSTPGPRRGRSSSRCWPATPA